LSKNILIPSKINQKEVLVHYIFSKHFKKKLISSQISDLVNREILMPNRGGVSLQRAEYCNENQCKSFAVNIEGRIYAGFLIFTKEEFENVKSLYKEKSRPDFEAAIIHSPLNETFEYLPKDIEVFINSKGNPSHSDLKYLNPAEIQDETPNTAIRSFTKKLIQVCKLLIDETPLEDSYTGIMFHS
tara:strand:- start:109 stop:666 length:558 start_codon:yes stop_codon:yes gene_type:complete